MKNLETNQVENTTTLNNNVVKSFHNIEFLKMLVENKNWVSRDFITLIKASNYYTAYKITLQEKFKKLTGSEKQIAFAEKIRDEKLDCCVTEFSIAKAHYFLEQAGFFDMGFDYNAKIKDLKIEYAYLMSNSASLIIDNRF